MEVLNNHVGYLGFNPGSSEYKIRGLNIQLQIFLHFPEE